MANCKLTCCETCQIYWTCETKWYRGEKGEENICCKLCNYYNRCVDNLNKSAKDRSNKPS